MKPGKPLRLNEKASISLCSTLARSAQRLPASAAARTLGLPQGGSVEAVRLPLLVEGDDPEAVERLLAEKDPKGDVLRLSDHHLSVEVKPSAAQALLSLDGIDRVQTKKLKAVLLERALADIGVAAGPAAPFEETGAGVLVGVIDTGFDLSHPAFRDDRTKRLRVEALLDQTNGGLEYDRAVLQRQWANRRGPGDDGSGHGTHVASIAAGRTDGLLGVAPDAHFLLVKSDFLNTDKALRWIFSKADTLRKPCVVNMSLGHHFGAHDGSDVEERLMGALSGPGKIVVVAAGNERTDQLHIGARFHAGQAGETNFDVLRQPDELPHVTLTLWYDERDQFELSLLTPSGDEVALPPVGQSQPFQLSYGSLTLSRGRYRWGGLCQCQIEIGYSVPDVSERLLRDWRLSIRCDSAVVGRLDGWFHNSGYARFAEGRLLEAARTVGIPAGSEACLAVASHATRSEWLSDHGPQSDRRLVLGRSSPFSSMGPTRDGRWKPDVSAPGQYVTAALAEGSRLAETEDRAVAASRLLTIEGTSMAAPVVAGIVALLLQKRPDLDTAAVRGILRETARRDEHTGPASWDPAYGHGKVHAAAALARL